MGADALAPATLQPQSFKKEWKPTHQQPDLITFSSFGSLNLSKRNQSHQSRRSELSHWSDMNQPDLITFSSFGSQNLPKRNQTHQTRRSELKWFQALAAKTCPKGIKLTKPGNQNYRIARFEYFSKLWQPKPAQKYSKSPNQKIRFDVVWMGADDLAPATLQPQSFKKEWKPTHQQPDLITFSSFGSLNLSKRNQSHQSRRSELSHWSDMNQPDLNTFSSFGSQNLPKSNQTHQTRRSELKWFQSLAA